jgi:hypothetical protein
MMAVVYRNDMGPVELWLIKGEDSDVPDSASLPDSQDDRTSVFPYKGPELSWQAWGGYLSSQPGLGNWAVEQVPGGMDAHDTLAYVRERDTRNPPS